MVLNGCLTNKDPVGDYREMIKMRVLVAYASKHGDTQGIAERIAMIRQPAEKPEATLAQPRESGMRV